MAFRVSGLAWLTGSQFSAAVPFGGESGFAPCSRSIFKNLTWPATTHEEIADCPGVVPDIVTLFVSAPLSMSSCPIAMFPSLAASMSMVQPNLFSKFGLTPESSSFLTAAKSPRFIKRCRNSNLSLASPLMLLSSCTVHASQGLFLSRDQRRYVIHVPNPIRHARMIPLQPALYIRSGTSIPSRPSARSICVSVSAQSPSRAACKPVSVSERMWCSV